MLLTLFHASRRGRLLQCVLLAVTAAAVETASIRLGGTHCHASSPFGANASACSSLNSILYYVPWMYVSHATAVQLTLHVPSLLPFALGAMMMLYCSVYEMQGPILGLWRWPDLDSGLVSATAQLYNPLNATASATPGLYAVPNVQWALAERAFGFPLAALLYHFAMGFGYGAALQLFGRQRHALALLLTSPFAMLYDLGMRGFEALGASKLLGVPLLLLLSVVLPVLLAPPSARPAEKPLARADYLLTLIPLLNAAYFASLPLRHPQLPHDRRLHVLVVAAAVVGVAAHVRANILAPTWARKTKQA